MINYLKRLNWRGFVFVILLSMIGALSNKNINTFFEWLILVCLFGIPFGLFFLFAGKE